MEMVFTLTPHTQSGAVLARSLTSAAALMTACPCTEVTVSRRLRRR